MAAHDNDDPVLRELAATTDAQLAAMIRVSARRLVDLAAARRRALDWPHARAAEWRAHEALRMCWAALCVLRDDAELGAVTAVVGPVLNARWQATSPAAARVAAAVEGLRTAAHHRPALVREARQGVDDETARARASAWGAYVDLVYGLIPALEVGEIYDGEAAAELLMVLAAVQVDAGSWDPIGRQVAEDLTRAADFLRAGQTRVATQLLRSAEANLYLFAVVP